MYLAEIHGKLSRKQENQEDILTSNVFSFFKYAPRNIFLSAFIQNLGLNVSLKDTENAEFHFWPRYEDNTEPDLVIIIGCYYLLFEAKYFSGFSEETVKNKHQLIREIEGGMLEAENLGKDFRIVVITAHYCYDSAIFADVPEGYANKLIWTNWQRVTFLLKQKLETNTRLSPEVNDFATDLYALLVKKRLRSFEGISTFQNLSAALVSANNVFFQAETAQYRGDFLGFVLSLSTLPKQKRQISKSIFFSPSKEYFCHLHSPKSLKPVDYQEIFFHRSKP